MRLIFDMLLTLWVLGYTLLVILDNTPCDCSIKKAFLFLSSFIIFTTMASVIWSSYLLKLLN